MEENNNLSLDQLFSGQVDINPKKDNVNGNLTIEELFSNQELDLVDEDIDIISIEDKKPPVKDQNKIQLESLEYIKSPSSKFDKNNRIEQKDIVIPQMYGGIEVLDSKENFLDAQYDRMIQQYGDARNQIQDQTKLGAEQWSKSPVGKEWWLNNWSDPENKYIINRKGLTPHQYEVSPSTVSALDYAAGKLLGTQKTMPEKVTNAIYSKSGMEEFMPLIDDAISYGGENQYVKGLNSEIGNLLSKEGVKVDSIVSKDDPSAVRSDAVSPQTIELAKQNFALKQSEGISKLQDPLVAKIGYYQREIIRLSSQNQVLNPINIGDKINYTYNQSIINDYTDKIKKLKKQYFDKKEEDAPETWFDPTSGKIISYESANESQRAKHEETKAAAQMKWGDTDVEALYQKQNILANELIYLYKEAWKRKSEISNMLDFFSDPGPMFAKIEEQANSNYIVDGLYYLPSGNVLTDKINSKLSDLELINQAIELNFDPSKREANVGFFDNVAPAFSYGASYLESKLKAQPIEYVETKYKTPSEANQALAFANFAYESLGEEKYEEIKKSFEPGFEKTGSHLVIDGVQIAGEFMLTRGLLSRTPYSVENLENGVKKFGYSLIKEGKKGRVITGVTNLTSSIVGEGYAIAARNQLVRPLGGHDMDLVFALGAGPAGSIIKGSQNILLNSQTYRNLYTAINKSSMASGIISGTIKPTLGTFNVTAGQIVEQAMKDDVTLAEAWKDATKFEQLVNTFVMVASAKAANPIKGLTSLYEAGVNDIYAMSGQISSKAGRGAKVLDLTNELKERQEYEVEQEGVDESGQAKKTKAKKSALTEETVDETLNKRLKEEGLDKNEEDLSKDELERKNKLTQAAKDLKDQLLFFETKNFIQAKYGANDYANIYTAGLQFSRGLDLSPEQKRTFANLSSANQAYSIIRDAGGPFSPNKRFEKAFIDYFDTYHDFINKIRREGGTINDPKVEIDFIKKFDKIRSEAVDELNEIYKTIKNSKSPVPKEIMERKRELEQKVEDFESELRSDLQNLTTSKRQAIRAQIKDIISKSRKKGGKFEYEVLSDKEFNDRFGDEESSTFGFYDTGNKIFINEGLSKKLNNITVDLHELLHPSIDQTLDNLEAKGELTGFIQDFKSSLPNEVRALVQERINDRDDIIDKEFTREWFNETAEVLGGDQVKINKNRGFKKLGQSISNMFKSETNLNNVSFRTGRDAYDFVARYAKKFRTGAKDVEIEEFISEKLAKLEPTKKGERRRATTPKGELIEKISDLDKLDWKKYKTKQEFQNSPEFASAYDFISNSPQLRNLIKSRLRTDLRTDINIERAQDLLVNELLRFDPIEQFKLPEIKQSLGAYIGDLVNKKVGTAAKEGERKGDGRTISADKPVGKAEAPISETIKSKDDIETKVEKTLKQPEKEVKIPVSKQVGLPETFARGANEGNDVNEYIDKITENINFEKLADVYAESGKNQMISPFIRDLKATVTKEAETKGADIAESMGIGKKYQEHLRNNFETIVKSIKPSYFSGLQARKGDMPKGMVEKSVGGKFNEQTGEFEPNWTSEWVGKETDRGKVSTVGLSSGPEYIRINPNFNFKNKAAQDQFINAFKPQMRKRGLAVQMLAEGVVRNFAEKIGKDNKLTERFEQLSKKDTKISEVAKDVSAQIAKSNWQRSAASRKLREFSSEAFIELNTIGFRNQLAKEILDINVEDFSAKSVKKAIDNVYKDKLYEGRNVPNDIRKALADDLYSMASLLKTMKKNAENAGMDLEINEVKWVSKNIDRSFDQNLKDLLNIPQSIILGGKNPNLGESNKLINQQEQVELTKQFFDQYIKKNKTALEKAEALAKLYKFRGQYSDASKIGLGRDQYFSSVSDFVEKVIKPTADQNNINIKINNKGGLESIKVGKKTIEISKSMKQSVDALMKEEYFKPNGEIDYNNPKVKKLIKNNHEEADVAREILVDQFKFMSNKFHNGTINPIDFALWTMSLKSSMETVLRAAGKLKYVYKPLEGEGIITIKGSGAKRGAYQNGKKLNLDKVSDALIYEHKRPAEHMIQSMSRLFLDSKNIENTKQGWDLNKEGKVKLEKLFKNYTVSIVPKKGGFDDAITDIGYKDYDPADMDRYFNERSFNDPRMRSLIDLETGEIEGQQWGEAAQIQYNKILAKENIKGAPFQRSTVGKSNFEVLQELNNHDKALRLARNPKKKIKKLRAFDFDDTVGTSKNIVIAKRGGEELKLNAEEFAKRGLELIDEGWKMDFSDFNKVTQGGKGPLFDLMKKVNESKGERDVFILTARAPESAKAIHTFLKENGIDIPLKNVIGLGNSTGEAKAQWLVGKASEGYNDFFFADDAIQNVNAVKKALSVLDVKSKVQQANIQRSTVRSKQFNELLEQTTGVEAYKEYSAAKAKTIGANKGKFKFFIPYSAEDFTGLIYPTLTKGKLGDKQMAWYKENLLNPYSRAMSNLSKDRVQLMSDFKELKKVLDVPKDLRKINDTGFTNEQAVRVYLYNKMGHEVPGLSKTDLKELLDVVNSDGKLKAFADQILGVTKGDGYIKPKENWLFGTITTDLIDLLNTTKRSKYLEEWQNNVDEIYSKENLNKLEAIYGSKYREALENSLARMKSGKNRLATGGRLSNQMLDYINGSNAAIMFFNTRSAVLQSISAINYINWSFNNPYKAGKAFANQAQYWKDFKMLMNSDYLVDRRNGLKLNIAESEIADAAATSKNKAKAVLKYIQQKGYLPTQYMDSFAIASGGATFYRNRINDLVKKGMEIKQAEKLALKEWRDLAEESQQSSDPSKISQQQSSDAGRLILMFANTPMQYARLQKRAFQDLINGRGDAKSNISKIVYYGFIQNMLFNGLQQALFKLGFGDDDIDEKDEKVIRNTANGMLDSILRGTGISGQLISVSKNFLLDIYERSGRKRPEYVDSMWKLLQFSPPISSKISRLRQAAYAFDSKERREEIFDKGFSLDNPALMASAKVISATANLPLDRVLQKYYNIEASMSDEADWWQTLAMLGGWPEWSVMDKEKDKKSTKSSFEYTRRTIKRGSRRR